MHPTIVLAGRPVITTLVDVFALTRGGTKVLGVVVIRLILLQLKPHIDVGCL